MAKLIGDEGMNFSGSAGDAEYGLGLEAELEELFAQIEEKEPGIVVHPGAAAAPAAPVEPAKPDVAAGFTAAEAEEPVLEGEMEAPRIDAEMERQIEEALAQSGVVAEEAPAAEASVAAGDDPTLGLNEAELSAHLTELLSGAPKRSVAATARAPAVPAEASGSGVGKDLADDLQELLDAAKTQEPSPKPKPDVSGVGESEGEASTIAQVDAAIAAEADEAVAGAFETIDDVLGGHAPASPPAEPARAGAPAGDSSGGDDVQFVTEEDEGLEGDFAAPDSVSEKPSTAAAEAAIHMPLPTRAEDEPAVEGPRGGHDLPGLLWPLVGTLKVVAVSLRRPAYRTLAIVNSPLGLLSPESRKLVGYAALLTTFNAACLLIYAVLT